MVPALMRASRVDEQHPLEQGLKLDRFWDILMDRYDVNEQHPLEQGLKQVQ